MQDQYYDYSDYYAPPPPPPPPKRRIDWRTIAAIAIALIGVALLSSWFIGNAVKKWRARELVKQIDNEGLDKITINNSTYEEDSEDADVPAVDNTTAAQDPAATPDPAASDVQFGSSDVKKGKERELEVLGKLVIPKINIELPLVKGADAEALKYGVGQLRGSDDIGTEGNTVIAGHRSFDRGAQFNKLGEVVEGDLVEVVTKERHYIYRVIKTMIVEPDDQRYYEAEEGKYRITLYTCHPIVQSTYRLIKICDLVALTDKEGNDLPLPTPNPTASKAPKATPEPLELDEGDGAGGDEATPEPSSEGTPKPTATPKPSGGTGTPKPSASGGDTGRIGGDKVGGDVASGDVPNVGPHGEGVPAGALAGGTVVETEALQGF